MRDWLFERLDLDLALTGDLLEERQRGRWAFWYWKQVLIAIWVGFRNAIRDHKLLVLRAVAVGFAVEYSFVFLWWMWGSGLSDITDLCLVLLTATVTGWVIARTHRAYRMPMVLAYLFCCLLWGSVPQLGWIRTVVMDWDRLAPASHWAFSYFCLCFILTIAGILIGGILVRPQKA